MRWAIQRPGSTKTARFKRRSRRCRSMCSPVISALSSPSCAGPKATPRSPKLEHGSHTTTEVHRDPSAQQRQKDRRNASLRALADCEPAAARGHRLRVGKRSTLLRPEGRDWIDSEYLYGP